jgi:hypothetical protein
MKFARKPIPHTHPMKGLHPNDASTNGNVGTGCNENRRKGTKSIKGEIVMDYLGAAVMLIMLLGIVFGGG